MKRLLSACALGLAITSTLALTGCDKANKYAVDSSPIALQKTDTVAGSGKEAVPGATVVVNYTGWLYAPRAEKRHGAQFDSSAGREPFSFRLGAGEVIRGWDEGVAGMKVGGKRTILIPAGMGYGAEGAGPIPPNANLIFDVELLDVR